MVPKSKRNSSESVRNIMKNGQSKHSDHFSLRYTKAETTHFSVVVSKKVIKSAVGRNTLRRQIYSILQDLPVSPARYILFPKKTILNLKPDEKRQEVEKLFNIH